MYSFLCGMGRIHLPLLCALPLRRLCALTMPVQLLGFLSLFLIRDGQLCVIYSRWHRPRLGLNAAIGFGKIIDGRMRFEGLLVIAR